MACGRVRTASTRISGTPSFVKLLSSLTLQRLCLSDEQEFRSRTLMASLDPDSLGRRPLRRSCRFLRPLPAEKRPLAVALLRRLKARRCALGQIRATDLEMERPIAEQAPDFLRKIFQESRLISLAQASAALPGHTWNSRGSLRGRGILQSGTDRPRCTGTVAGVRKARGPRDARTSACLQIGNASRQ